MDVIMKGAYLVKKKEDGMTLIEVIISFSILLIIISVFPLTFGVLSKENIETIRHEERVLFFSQLQMDFRRSANYWTNPQQTVLFYDRPEDGATIQFELYEDKVRRRVNRTGHEVFLQNVKQFQVEVVGNGIKLTIIGIGDECYVRNIPHPDRNRGKWDD
ncbi:ComGF family competence protein [Evansella tamaricis]|uniref:ComGF family competence protein n=1 Tax=Evansella tamaricis TaxID=2069301 RepID=A0ABS6JEZ6_9BACI|nr:ComGF family competence protein [Evansella tamaricis]MBU9712234.1 ComGF family competence protein [Evansella tamaricis]